MQGITPRPFSLEMSRHAHRAVTGGARIDMTLNHDRTGELHKIDRPSLVLGTIDDSTVPVYF